MDFDYTENLHLLTGILDKAQKQFAKDIKLQGNVTNEERAQIAEMDRVIEIAHNTTSELARKAKSKK